MMCYECSSRSLQRPAVALCHHCSAGLCVDHCIAVNDPVTARYPVCATVVLPRKARLFLCQTCKEALEQPREAKIA
jgi:hypothetical protein